MTFHPRSRLREKQLTIVRELMGSTAMLIVSGMGSGKTAASLTAIRDMLDLGLARRILIIAPLRVATDVWPDEIEAWEHTRMIDYAVCCGTPEERIAALAKNATITIINRESLVWLAQQLRSIVNWPFDTVFVDESSMFKLGENRTKPQKVKVNGWGALWGDTKELAHPRGFLDRDAAEAWIEYDDMLWDLLGETFFRVAERTGKVKVTKTNPGGKQTRFGIMTTARQKIKRIYLLTGTPRPNGVQDLWGQCYLLDQGKALGMTKSSFIREYFNKNQYTHEVEIKDGAEATIMSKVAHLMVSLPPDKLVEDPIMVPVRVKLPAAVMREYREFEETLVSQPYDVEAVSQGVLANKLLQFACGSMYREDGSVVPVHTAKLDALEQLVEDAGGDNLLIFYTFKFDLETLRKKYPGAVVLNEDKDAVKNWNAGKIRILLAHPASCAHGLNLQHGGHICIWFGPIWSLELWQQANARLPRPGQLHQVYIYVIIAEGTYDERADEVLRQKDAGQQKMIDSIVHYLYRAG